MNNFLQYVLIYYKGYSSHISHVSKFQVLDLNSGSPLAVSNFVDEQTTREIVTIQTASTLTAGKRYKISMDFISILNDELRGFYRSSYMENGVKKCVLFQHTSLKLDHI